MLQGLPGMLMPRQVIFLLVMRSGHTVGVCGHLVKFRGSLV